MADVEALGAGDGDVLERLAGQRRMMIEHQRVDRIAVARFGPRQADEGDDRAVAARGLGQLGKLELRVERLRLEKRDDAHPPDTGGRNSTLVRVADRLFVTDHAICRCNARERPSVCGRRGMVSGESPAQHRRPCSRRAASSISRPIASARRP